MRGPSQSEAAPVLLPAPCMTARRTMETDSGCSRYSFHRRQRYNLDDLAGRMGTECRWRVPSKPITLFLSRQTVILKPKTALRSQILSTPPCLKRSRDPSVSKPIPQLVCSMSVGSWHKLLFELFNIYSDINNCLLPHFQNNYHDSCRATC